ncbi:MAG: M48 family metallopeptidase [Clostridia bacterium]|nr:M48 family metallopeptidase [Clostridia bacterium]
MYYEIIYSKRKTVSLCIKEEKLIVRAPYGVTKKKIDEIVSKHEKWILTHLERQRQKSKNEPPLTDNDIKELKRQARIILTSKTERFSEIMGLKYGRITITSAKTRFGSCSSKGNISYSYRLMLYPEAAVDYVVVHELAHLLEMNHSRRFYAIIEKVLPDYKERKKLLK